MKAAIFGFVLLLALAPASTLAAGTSVTRTGGGTGSSMMGERFTVRLAAINGSGESGTAIFSPAISGGTKIVVQVIGEPAGASQPAHLHMGPNCKIPGAVFQPLSNVVGGFSTTTVPRKFSWLRSHKYSVNIHKSARQLSTYVSCGTHP